jgi:hypothetical protein
MTLEINFSSLQLFVVEMGEHDGHRVCAIFSTRELARNWIERHKANGMYDYSINDAWKLDSE